MFKKFFKKLYFNIYTFCHTLFRGLENANSVAFETGDSSNDSGGGIEVKKHRKSVLEDLLKGVVTEEVKALRYEMYLTEQKSNEYKYIGNGVARKYDKEELESRDEKIKSPYEGYETVTVIHNVSIDSEGYDNKTLKITRDGFIPRFRLEHFAEKACLYKNLYDGSHRLDIHVQSYNDRTFRIMKMFINEVFEIMNNLKKSDLVDFESVEFSNRYLQQFKLSDISFTQVVESEGYFIFSFNVGSVIVTDIPSEYFHEDTHKKFEEKAPRNERTTLEYDAAVKMINEDLEYEREQKAIDEFLSES